GRPRPTWVARGRGRRRRVLGGRRAGGRPLGGRRGRGRVGGGPPRREETPAAGAAAVRGPEQQRLRPVRPQERRPAHVRTATGRTQEAHDTPSSDNRYESNTCRTFCASAAGVNGFCNRSVPVATPCRRTASSV